MEELQKVKDRIEQVAKNGKIPCAEALRLAEKLNISPYQLGKIADRSRIKIISCQLGCFGEDGKGD